MTIHRPSDELIDRLAADYALGTMSGGARRRFERALREDARVAQAVMRWQQRLLPLDARLPPAPAGAALWARIERQAFGGATVAAADAAPAQARRWWQRWFAPLPAGALAMGLLLGSLAPALYRQLQADAFETQLPESYVGVLATADGRPGLIVSSLRRGRVVDLKRLAPVAATAAQVPYLWTLDAQGRAQAVGPLPDFDGRGLASLKLAQPAEALFQRAVELAVSLEAAGATPAQPSGAFVYRGLCGKLWPPAPAAAGSR
ncbi:MAG: anti-sigma factor [Proteobacteria bacterium]|nr:anti-sigma factor [Pseudomonadota bacterium]